MLGGEVSSGAKVNMKKLRQWYRENTEQGQES